MNFANFSMQFFSSFSNALLEMLQLEQTAESIQSNIFTKKKCCLYSQKFCFSKLESKVNYKDAIENPWNCPDVFFVKFNPLSANSTKWSNTLR